MNQLLTANFARLIRNKVFWLCTAFQFVFGVFIVFINYRDRSAYGMEVPLDRIFFAYTMLIGILCSVFCSLYLGTEYSDGTIRNKLAAGHSRSSIYLANLIVCFTAGLLLCLSFLLPVSILGIPLLGPLRADLRFVWILLFDSAVMVLAISSVFVLLSMLNQNKAAAAVISILGFIAFLILASYISERLKAPEYYDGYVFTDSSGKNMEGEKIPNPEFLRGTERSVYQFFYDFLPTGQAMQINDMSARHLWQMPLYSLFLTFAVTAGGLILFRRKDIK